MFGRKTRSRGPNENQIAPSTHSWQLTPKGFRSRSRESRQSPQKKKNGSWPRLEGENSDYFSPEGFPKPIPIDSHNSFVIIHALQRSCVLAALVLLASSPASAQSDPAENPAVVGRQLPPTRLGVGLQAGPFSGFSIKAYPKFIERRFAPFEAIVLTGSVNFNDLSVFHALILDETAVPGSPLVLYLGPGVVFGSDEGSVFVGVAAVAGVRFFKGRYEIFLELSPRLVLLPERDALDTAAVGFRVYF
ncbi:MAG: hypothetical protein ACI80V_001874 [Rhodothermales bacterium]|jgi:hypothetical protein